VSNHIIKDASEAQELMPKKRRSPAQKLIDELDPEYYSVRQAADVFGVHVETMRRLLRSDLVKAPSKVLQQGKMFIWLVTEEDLVEIAEFYGQVPLVRKHLVDKYEGGKMPQSLEKRLESA